MSMELELLEIYERSIKEGSDKLTPIPEKKEVKIGQIRELWSLPTERFVILEEVGEGLFLTAPMTSYLQVLPSDSPMYELKSQGLRLGIIPVWDYLRRELIEEFSTVIGRVSTDEITKIKEYISKPKTLKYATKRFIKLNSKRWAKWTMYSLLAQAELAEREEGQVIKISRETEERLYPYRTYALAAENRYFKGKNYFAILKEKALRLYFPVELVGRIIKIAIGNEFIFEGELESVKLDIEGDFSGINIQEELKVVEL